MSHSIQYDLDFCKARLANFVETFVETFYKNTLDLLKNDGFFTSKIARIKSEIRCGTIRNKKKPNPYGLDFFLLGY